MTKVWKNVTVTKTVEMLVGIEEDRLTPEFLEYYSKYFHEADSPDEIFDAVAFQYVQGYEKFAEGVGNVGSAKWDKRREEEFAALVEIKHQDVEVEVGGNETID